MQNSQKKPDLKNKFCLCLKKLFEEAERKKQTEIEIRASKLQEETKIYNRFPSICNVMKSALNNDCDEITSGVFNSSTYTIKYKLPREVVDITAQNDKSEKYLTRLLTTFSDSKYQKQCVDTCKKDYRTDDAGRIFYKYVISYPPKKKFTLDYIKYVYAMLNLWNMNSRGAELSTLKTFTDTILENNEKINSLSKYKLSEIDDKSIEILKELFNNLTLVNTKSPLVTFSKTLHFFLPKLIVPIDRTYTCAFFGIYPNQKKGSENEFQRDIFLNLHKAFCEFTKQHNLSGFVDKTSDSDWNLNIPKVIDNMLIGHGMIN